VPPRRVKASGKRAQGTAANAAWSRPAAHPNDVWSYDFMSAVTRDGRPLRILNVVDEHTRVCVGCKVARSIGAGEVAAVLERLFAEHGKPAVMRSDNGREFIAASLGDWLDRQGVSSLVETDATVSHAAPVDRSSRGCCSTVQRLSPSGRNRSTCSAAAGLFPSCPASARRSSRTAGSSAESTLFIGTRRYPVE
jgi:hypothetical protein